MFNPGKWPIVPTPEGAKKKEQKEEFDDLLKFKEFMFAYTHLSAERYAASPTKKEEIKESMMEIKDKVDAEFLSKLGAIKDLRLNVNDKRKLIDLFKHYNRYLYNQNLYDYENVERAQAVEITSSLLTDGSDSFKVEEWERFKDLNRRAEIEQNLTAEEMNELGHLKHKRKRIEQLLEPGRWKELDYKPFDPMLELRNIRHFSPEERESLSSEQRREIQKERLAHYKEQLLKQKEGIAELQISLEKSIRDNPDISPQELMDLVYVKALGAKLANHQIDAFRKGLRIYVGRHEAVETYREQYKDDKNLFEACFGHSPKGDIEIIKGPMTLYFRCHNLEDYALLRNRKFEPKEKLDKHDMDRANVSGGAYISGAKIPELGGCIIAENARGRPFNKKTYAHEEQHSIKKLFEDEIIRQDLVEALEKSPIKEKEKALVNRLRTIRERFENWAKDEVLAYVKGGKELGQIEKFLLEQKGEGGLYDYYREWYEKTRGKEREELIKAGANETSVDMSFYRVFIHEYQEIIHSAVESLKTLKNKDFSKEKIINLLINEPLSRWPKMVKRLEIL